jgi:hypothetical protein
MIENYKKKNVPVPVEERNCRAVVGASHDQHNHDVGAGACKAFCVFQDDQNEWCFQTVSPALVTGWTWFQNTGTDFYQIMWKPYVTSQLDLKYWIEIQRMMQQQLDI